MVTSATRFVGRYDCDMSGATRRASVLRSVTRSGRVFLAWHWLQQSRERQDNGDARLASPFSRSAHETYLSSVMGFRIVV